MKKFVSMPYFMAVLLGLSSLWAQEVLQIPVPLKSNYDYHDAFAPFFLYKKWNNNTVRKRSTGCRILAK
jgi:hypothetical protein